MGGTMNVTITAACSCGAWRQQLEPSKPNDVTAALASMARAYRTHAKMCRALVPARVSTTDY